MTSERIYKKIYDEALNIFITGDGTDCNAYDYLMEEVDKGKISIDDAHCMIKDIWKEIEV